MENRIRTRKQLRNGIIVERDRGDVKAWYVLRKCIWIEP